MAPASLLYIYSQCPTPPSAPALAFTKLSPLPPSFWTLQWLIQPKPLAFDLRQASLLVQLIKNCLQCRRLRFNSWVGKIPWRRYKLRTPVFLGFPCCSAGKEFACNLGDLGSIPGLERFPWRREGLPTPVFWAWRIPWTVHGVAKSQTWLSNFHLTSDRSDWNFGSTLLLP